MPVGVKLSVLARKAFDEHSDCHETLLVERKIEVLIYLSALQFFRVRLRFKLFELRKKLLLTKIGAKPSCLLLSNRSSLQLTPKLDLQSTEQCT